MDTYRLACCILSSNYETFIASYVLEGYLFQIRISFLYNNFGWSMTCLNNGVIAYNMDTYRLTC